MLSVNQSFSSVRQLLGYSEMNAGMQEEQQQGGRSDTVASLYSYASNCARLSITRLRTDAAFVKAVHPCLPNPSHSKWRAVCACASLYGRTRATTEHS